MNMRNSNRVNLLKPRPWVEKDFYQMLGEVGALLPYEILVTKSACYMYKLFYNLKCAYV